MVYIGKNLGIYFIHGRYARSKWAVTKTTATKDIRLKKKPRVIMPTTSAEKLRIIMSITSTKRKSTIKYARPCGQVDE